MVTRIKILIVLIGLMIFSGVSAGEKGDSGSIPFDIATARFEHNATDGDFEAVFEARGGDQGLSELTVVGPDGRTVIDFKAPDASTMGIRSFRFETPEPKDLPGLKAAYPEGSYSFSGATSDGTRFSSESTLNHTLPATATFIEPEAEAEDVDTNLEIRWASMQNLAYYLIEVEQEDTGTYVTAKIPGSSTSFAVPQGFLQPGKEYKAVIGTISEDGNGTFVETTFTIAAATTAGKN